MTKYINNNATVLVIDNKEIEAKDGIFELTEDQFQQVKHCGFIEYIEETAEVEATEIIEEVIEPKEEVIEQPDTATVDKKKTTKAK